MSHAIFKIRIKVHEKTDLFVLFASNKSQLFLELNLTFLSLNNDVFWSDVLKASDLDPVSSPTRLVKLEQFFAVTVT